MFKKAGSTLTDTPTFGRYTELPVEQMTPEQQAGRRRWLSAARGVTERLEIALAAQPPG